MILTRSLEFTVNMGNYESCKVGASVTVDTAELPSDVTDPTQFMEDKLEEIMASDVKEVTELTNTKDSFVLSWKAV